ncbi:hypothetical protein [Clostridium psychrophilum]|uniref:hypothetical protein n=1 Tax=Clostridium psychrophilum TaxID=132926 RepID=UPI001C0E0BFA|nr:hypothetical protein [Clostridium psychrophilum]MBU3181737.1 hypothetical protein [Clostridium psychrophilum]
MSKLRDNVFLAIILTGSSAIIYFIQNAIFHQPLQTVFYIFQDMAFMPFQALIATLIIDQFLKIEEKRRKIKKTNVVISTFFVDAGVNIMMAMSRFNQNHNEACKSIKIEKLIVNKGSSLKKAASELEYCFYADPNKLDELASIMDKNKEFLLNLLENSNLLEHESFTDMLWAVFHVADELKTRGDLKRLSRVEIDHISEDMLRAYTAMVMEWISYIIYLKDEYPFLYASAIRKNPFYKVII